jgi:hypothetical protein
MYVMFCTMQPQILGTLSACPVAGNHPYGATGKEGKIKEVVKDRRCDEDGKVPVGLSGPLIFFFLRRFVFQCWVVPSQSPGGR